jgi:hypothetical protein
MVDPAVFRVILEPAKTFARKELGYEEKPEKKLNNKINSETV